MNIVSGIKTFLTYKVDFRSLQSCLTVLIKASKLAHPKPKETSVCFEIVSHISTRTDGKEILSCLGVCVCVSVGT